MLLLLWQQLQWRRLLLLWLTDGQELLQLQQGQLLQVDR
jgi:hypothetical protein